MAKDVSSYLGSTGQQSSAGIPICIANMWRALLGVHVQALPIILGSKGNVQ